MTLKRLALRPIAFVAGLHASRQVRAFLRAHQDTAAVQDRLLMELVGRHARTDFGRDHGFDRIRNYQDFVAAVPIRTYDDLRPYVDRVLQGQISALLPADEEVLMFSQTSGTTGSPKHIPVTRRFLTEIRRGWNVWGLRALRDHSDAWLRHILQISSPMHESVSPTGLPCGAISGLLAITQKKIVRRMYVVPGGVSDIADPAARFYTLLRCGIGQDVSNIVTANPSSTIKLIETGQQHVERLLRDVADGSITPPGDVSAELRGRLSFRPRPDLVRRIEAGVARDGMLLPRHFWKLAFLGNWTGGTLKLYLKKLHALFGDVPVRDIGLLASEGRLSVPIHANTPAGIADILSNFLEFIPVEDYAAADRQAPVRTLRAHELQVGAEYFLVLSNWAGLWRYSLDDRIRVTAHVGQSPVIEFLSRGLHTANITGEKVTEHQVVEAMARAARHCSTSVDRFILQARFAQTPYYELRLEPPQGVDPAALATAMDAALCELNVEYHSKRKSDRLGAIRPAVLTRGTLDQAEAAHIARRRGRSEQYKHQYLLTDVACDE